MPIAAAYSSQLDDGWARYIYWQQPSDGKIVVKRRGTGTEPVEVRTTVKPRKNSPLAAHYISDSNNAENDNVRPSPSPFSFSTIPSSGKPS